MFSSTSIVLLLLLSESVMSGIGTAEVGVSSELPCHAHHPAPCHNMALATGVDKPEAHQNSTLHKNPNSTENVDQKHLFLSGTVVGSQSSLTKDGMVSRGSLSHGREALSDTSRQEEIARRENLLPAGAAGAEIYVTTDNNATQKTTGPAGFPDQLQKQGHIHLPQLSSEVKHNTTSDERGPSQDVARATHVLHNLELVKSASESISKASKSENSTDTDHQNTNSLEFTKSSKRVAFRNGRKLLLYDASARKESFASESRIHRDSELVSDTQEGTTADEHHSGPHEVTLVRKCCGQDEFINLQTQQCEAVEGGLPGFKEAVLELLPGNASSVLQYVSGPCPGTGNFPNIREAKRDSHSVLAFGHLTGHTSGVYYDHDHYCLDLAAPGPDLLASALLITSYCQPRQSDALTRKCCEPNQYFNTAVKECRSMSANTSDHHETLVHEFLRSSTKSAPIHVSTERLTCSCGSPKIVRADEVSLGAANQLCDHQTGQCYSTSRYCLEYVWEEGDKAMIATAAVCPLDFFQKCCPRDFVLTESGCSLASRVDVSARMMQLLELMEPQFSHPTEVDGEECVQEWVTLDGVTTQWWISRSGCLSIDTESESFTAERYCVDDYVGPGSETQTGAFICSGEQEGIAHPSAQPSAAGSMSKCCPHDHYLKMDDFSCVPDDLGLTLLDHSLLQAANVTKLTYTSFPVCETEIGYHYYYLDPESLEDHAELREDQVIEVVSLEGRCVLSKQPFQRENYCLEFGVDGQENKPFVLVCPDTGAGHVIHTEKYKLVASLLGVSCVALFATAFFLISARFWRKSISVSKVNTSMDRILLTYVLTCFVGFLLLAISMSVELSIVDVECQVMAGLLTFSLLAAFLWNTSICLEVLLLTLGASQSDGWRRYLYHSLWAWGVPALITGLAFVLDHHRHSLPCGIITPKFGLYKCFFSDATAQLVYLYVPMLVSVCANIILLVTSRYILSVKLRRLGKNSSKLGLPSGAGGTEVRRQYSQGGSRKTIDHAHSTPGSSHRRPQPHTTHTHKSWTDCAKLVLWSGVTWVLEVVGFVVPQYLVTPSESWYSYLWYVPSIINALRGVGIFFILVLTPENCLKLLHAFGSLGSQGPPNSSRDQVGNNPSGYRNGRGATQHQRMTRSVSQVDTLHSSASTASQEWEGVEMDAEVGAGVRRQSTASDAPVPQYVPVYNTKSVSEA